MKRRGARGSLLRASLPVAAAFLLFLGLALRLGASDGYHYYRAIGVGHLFADPSLLLPGQEQQKLPGLGFDGQFYFYIAQDPFLRNPLTAPALDNSLRYRRILYPLLAWALSLGHRAWLPYLLVGINVAACTAVVGAAATAARRAGRSAWLALAVAVFPGVWVSLLHDLTEPLQLALASWGVLLESAGLLLLSALAKETTAIVQLSEAVRSLAARRWSPALRNLAGLAVLAVWSLAVMRFVHAHAGNLAADFLTPPWAPVTALIEGLSNPALYFFLVPALGICVLSLVRLAWTRDRFALGAAAYSAVGLLAGITTWQDPLAEYRNTALAGVLVFMSWMGARDRLGFVVVVLMLFAGALALGAVATS